MYKLMINDRLISEASAPFRPIKNGWKNPNTGVEIQGGYLNMVQVYEDDDPENPVEPAEFKIRHPAFKHPVITVPAFKMCFTSAERQTIYALRDNGDAVITDWLSIVDDDKCTAVDLGLSGTQEAVNYLVGVVDGFTAERAAAVLTGTLI